MEHIDRLIANHHDVVLHERAFPLVGISIGEFSTLKLLFGDRFNTTIDVANVATFFRSYFLVCQNNFSLNRRGLKID